MLGRPRIKDRAQKRVIHGSQDIHAIRMEGITVGRNEDISTTEMHHT